MNSSPALKLVAALTCAAGSVAFWSLYFTLYWVHRHKFNEAGRYVDEATMVVYHEQSGLLVIPALASSALALVFAYFWSSARKPNEAKRQPQ